jgi:hypothetical protein
MFVPSTTTVSRKWECRWSLAAASAAPTAIVESTRLTAAITQKGTTSRQR